MPLEHAENGVPLTRYMALKFEAKYISCSVEKPIPLIPLENSEDL